MASDLHRWLCERAAKWLANTKRCPVALIEPVTGTHFELPDAFGWLPTGKSALVECKVSRADFHADKRKAFRRFPEMGIGTFRYYMAPRGLLKECDIPEGWGLLEIGGTGKRVSITRESSGFPFTESRAQREAVLLARNVCRSHEYRRVLVVSPREVEALDEKLLAHPPMPQESKDG